MYKYSIFLSCIQGQECKCFSAYKHRKVPYEEGKRKFIYTGIDSDFFLCGEDGYMFIFLIHHLTLWQRNEHFLQ